MPEVDMIDDLNMLLKGEISACETYKQALGKVEDASARKVLEANHQCHSARVSKLQNEVTAAGGTPAEGSGAWGAFAKTVEGGATVLGDKAAISVLEEGEDKGLADYKRVYDKHGTNAACVVELKAKQEGTHAKCRELKQSMA